MLANLCNNCSLLLMLGKPKLVLGIITAAHILGDCIKLIRIDYFIICYNLDGDRLHRTSKSFTILGP